MCLSDVLFMISGFAFGCATYRAVLMWKGKA
jgi:hypothetical protein